MRYEGMTRRYCRSRQTVRVGQLDSRYAGEAVLLILGQANLRHESDIAAVIDRVSEFGPASRVVASPSRESTRWPMISRPGASVLLADRSGGGVVDSIADCIERFADLRPDNPIAIWRCGRYVFVYCDHGLGDAVFFQKLTALVTNDRLPASLLAAGTDNVSSPVTTALRHALITNPRRFLRDSMVILRAAKNSTKGTEGRETSDVARRGDHREHFSAYFASGSTIGEFRSLRDRCHPGVSVVALIMHRVCESFAAMHSDLAPEVEVLVDLRRYLPGGARTQGNFNSVVRIPFSAGVTPLAFGRALNDELHSYRPLIALAGSVARAKWRAARDRRRTARDPLPPDSGTGAVQLTLTDFTRFVEGAVISYGRAEGSEMGLVTRPGSSRHVCVALAVSGDQRLQITANFDEGRVSRRLVKASVDRAVLCGDAPVPVRAS